MSAQANSFLDLQAGRFRARFLPWGARWVSFWAPDRSGRTADVLLGYETTPEYAQDIWSFGAVVGRCAGRIRGARFGYRDREFALTSNFGNHHIHGGRRGFGARLWDVVEHTTDTIVFRLESPDGDEGYPGTVRAETAYTLSESGALRMDLAAQTDSPTIVNLTNHAYFNLSSAGDVRKHRLTLRSDSVLELDEDLLPTGALVPVAGGPFDFRKGAPLGARLDAPEMVATGGFDHYYMFTRQSGARVPAAALLDPASGRRLTIETDAPGLQLYTANGLAGTKGRGGAYGNHAGVCLECMLPVDAVHQPRWPSPLLEPGAAYRQTTVFRFDVEGSAS